jgi:hypothetical protein
MAARAKARSPAAKKPHPTVRLDSPYILEHNMLMHPLEFAIKQKGSLLTDVGSDI